MEKFSKLTRRLLKHKSSSSSPPLSRPQRDFFLTYQFDTPPTVMIDHKTLQCFREIRNFELSHTVRDLRLWIIFRVIVRLEHYYENFGPLRKGNVHRHKADFLEELLYEMLALPHWTIGFADGTKSDEKRVHIRHRLFYLLNRFLGGVCPLNELLWNCTPIGLVPTVDVYLTKYLVTVDERFHQLESYESSIQHIDESKYNQFIFNQAYLLGRYTNISSCTLPSGTRNLINLFRLQRLTTQFKLGREDNERARVENTKYFLQLTDEMDCLIPPLMKIVATYAF